PRPVQRRPGGVRRRRCGCGGGLRRRSGGGGGGRRGLGGGRGGNGGGARRRGSRLSGRRGRCGGGCRGLRGRGALRGLLPGRGLTGGTLGGARRSLLLARGLDRRRTRDLLLAPATLLLEGVLPLALELRGRAALLGELVDEGGAPVRGQRELGLGARRGAAGLLGGGGERRRRLLLLGRGLVGPALERRGDELARLEALERLVGAGPHAVGDGGAPHGVFEAVGREQRLHGAEGARAGPVGRHGDAPDDGALLLDLGLGRLRSLPRLLGPRRRVLECDLGGEVGLVGLLRPDRRLLELGGQPGELDLERGDARRRAALRGPPRGDVGRRRSVQRTASSFTRLHSATAAPR